LVASDLGGAVSVHGVDGDGDVQSKRLRESDGVHSSDLHVVQHGVIDSHEIQSLGPRNHN
jgi:hypothetical protein